MARYKVYHRSRPDDYVIVEFDGWFPMEIKEKAINASIKFGFRDWTDLKVVKARPYDVGVPVG